MMIKNIILILVTIVTITIHPTPAYAYYDQLWEVENSDAIYNSITAKAGISNNEAAQTETQKQLDMIANAEGDSSIGYRIIVTKNSSLDAFATPGQSIFISLGMFNNFSKSERTAIIAHEWVHSSRHHMLDSMNKKEASSDLAEILIGVFAKGKDIKQVQQIAIGTKILQSQWLNRGVGLDHETDADRLGNDILFSLSAEGKANAGGMAGAFTRLKFMQGEGTQGGLGFLSSLVKPDSHASLDSRIKKSLERLKEYSNNRVEVKGAEIWLDGKLYKVAKYTTIGGRKTPAEVAACLEAGKLAEKTRTLEI